MRKLTAVAIDDEPLALEVIERFAAKSEDLDLLMAFENPLEAISFLQDNKVDLIFLDIQMPDLTGIQLLESLVYKPMIVFTTAYSQYAVDSYELGAIDYLLKPVSLDRFLKAINKAVGFVRAQEALDEVFKIFHKQPRGHLEQAQIYLKQGEDRKAREYLMVAQQVWQNADDNFEPLQEVNRLLSNI